MAEIHHLKGFRIRDDLSVCQNLRMLSLLIRSWQNIRPMVSDGQHRSIAMSSFLHGIFVPSPRVPTLPENEFEDPLPNELQLALTGKIKGECDLYVEQKEEEVSDSGKNKTSNRGKKQFAKYALCIYFWAQFN